MRSGGLGGGYPEAVDHGRKPLYSTRCHKLPTVQPLRVVRPDAVCEVGGSTPDLSYGDLGIFPGGGHPEKHVH